MSWSIARNQSLEKGLCKSLDHEIEECRARLTREDLRQKDVHEIRRSIKRIRAGVRLVHDDMRRRDYEASDDHFQKAGKQLSPLRDLHVLQTTLNSMLTK